MNEALAEFFKHNLWANLRLLDFCAGLSEEQLDASSSGTYGSIRDTLTHLFGAEERYVIRLMGKTPERSPLEHEGFPGIAGLRTMAQQRGEDLISIAEQFDAKQILRGEWRGEPYAMKAVVPLIQAINHATEHRAHIATILGQQGFEPPDMDSWAYGEAVANVGLTS